jgi:hypothetical protein
LEEFCAEVAVELAAASPNGRADKILAKLSAHLATILAWE